MKDKKILIIVATFIVIAAVTGASIAFFNYTRTGSPNSFQTGRIYFSTGQSNTITLTNVFPINESDLATDNGNHGTVTVTLTGDTEYSKGIEYLVTLDQVNNTINGKRIPIKFSVTPSNIGTSSDDYWNERGGSTSIYKLTQGGYVMEDKYALVGFISEGQTGINGNIQISAFIDASRILVSDTYDGSESDNMGTTNAEAEGKTVFTTTEWNSFGTVPLSFKVKVEANEGIWVEKETTPASCFTTIIGKNNKRNPEMNVSTCVSKLTEMGGNEGLQSGETLEAFCNGTGTLSGYTFQEILDEGNFSSSELSELESDGIIIYGMTITDYDASCGSEVVISTKMSGEVITRYTINPDMDVNTCVSTLKGFGGGLSTGTTSEGLCNGTGTYLGKTFQELLDEKYFSSSRIIKLENAGIITANTRMVQANVSVIDNVAFRSKNLTSVELPNTLISIGLGAFDDNQLTEIVIPDALYTSIAGDCNNDLHSFNIADEGVLIKNKSNTKSCSEIISSA